MTRSRSAPRSNPKDQSGLQRRCKKGKKEKGDEILGLYETGLKKN